MDLNQITLNVTDFDAALEFYDRLGLKLIVLSEQQYARFEMPSGGTTLSLHASDQPTLNGPVTYFECEDVDAAYDLLNGRGIIFSSAPKDEPWLWREARFEDPSGNRLCLFHAGGNRRFPPWRLERVPPQPIKKKRVSPKDRPLVLGYP